MRHTGQVATFDGVKMYGVNSDCTGHVTKADFAALALALQKPARFARWIVGTVWLGPVALVVMVKVAVRMLVHRRVLLLDPAPVQCARPWHLDKGQSNSY